jgi:hypothetical protein
MEELIRQIAEHQKALISLRNQINNPAYWIKKAQEEAGFIPAEGDWVSVEVERWKTAVHVYHRSTSSEGTKHWINGEWFDTSFPKKYPYIDDLIKKLSD